MAAVVQPANIVIPTISLHLPAVEAFPTSLCGIYPVGLNDHVGAEAAGKLRDIVSRMGDMVDFGPILRARTRHGLEKALLRAYRIATEYNIETGILIWRALRHDYTRLLRLSQASCSAVEGLYFKNAQRLDRDTFIMAVTSLRVLAKVGEWVIMAEGKADSDEQTPPLNYLDRVVLATFLTSMLLSYIIGEVKGALRENLRAIAQAMLSVATQVYQAAIETGLHQCANEVHEQYWSPAWQEGEVEADLDKQSGAVKSFASVEGLLEDLRRS